MPGWPVVSALLGPEGTSRTRSARLGGVGGLVSRGLCFRFCLARQTVPCFWLASVGGGCRGWGVGGVWWVGFWLLVENCIVDASIFVVKLSRANGGCLGTRSR